MTKVKVLKSCIIEQEIAEVGDVVELKNPKYLMSRGIVTTNLKADVPDAKKEKAAAKSKA